MKKGIVLYFTNILSSSGNSLICISGVTQLDPQSSNRLLVRQSYPFKTSGQQECESTRQVPAMKEKSRLITSDGSVIKIMKDGSVQVLIKPQYLLVWINIYVASIKLALFDLFDSL